MRHALRSIGLGVRALGARWPWAASFGAALLGCIHVTADGDEDRSVSHARSIASGLPASRPLFGLSEAEREQFCLAARKTLFSGTSVERECEFDSVLNAVLLERGLGTCEEDASDCAAGFIQLGVSVCASELELSGGRCQATVGDGEQCTLDTAELRERLLPDVSCELDVETARQRVTGTPPLNSRPDTPECRRYAPCRRTL